MTTPQELRTILQLFGVDSAITGVTTDTAQVFDGIVIYGENIDKLAQTLGQHLALRATPCSIPNTNSEGEP